MKKPFVSLEQLQEIVQHYPTPFHLYDEKGIRENARALYRAFSWNPGFREFFAVKATPNPQILKILKEEGCGVDCSSLCELMMSDRCGFRGEEIMFSSNDTPAEEFALASQLGATINLDDITHIDFLKDTIGSIPKRISCRYNPGGTFTLGESEEGFQVMDNPGDAKYGMTRKQLTQAFRRLKELGAEEFGIHAFLASNTLSNDYYPALARILFQLAAELKELTGQEIRVTIPGHFQRGGAPCAADRVLSSRFGAAAAELIREGKFGNMVALRDDKIVAVPLSEVAGKLKTVPPDCEIVAQARALGLSMGD